MLQQTRIIREDISSPLAVEEYSKGDILEARDKFWHFRIVMNPRLILREKWFPRSLAHRLRTFWDDFKAGKRPIMLLETLPQHGKSLPVIDFIAWCVGHDPELRVIYTSFSDRLSIHANLRVQRALDNPVYQRIFPNTKIEAKGGGRALRNYDILEFLDTDGYFRNSTVLGSITGEALDPRSMVSARTRREN
jgi:hypothetical protein